MAHGLEAALDEPGRQPGGTVDQFLVAPSARLGGESHHCRPVAEHSQPVDQDGEGFDVAQDIALRDHAFF